MKNIFFSFIICLIKVTAFSQSIDSAKISGEFNHVKAVDFITEIEKQSGAFFYFDISQLDSIKVNLTLTGQSLNTALERAFANTGINFSVYKNKYIFLTKEARVITVLEKPVPDSSLVKLNGPKKTVLLRKEQKLLNLKTG